MVANGTNDKRLLLYNVLLIQYNYIYMVMFDETMKRKYKKQSST